MSTITNIWNTVRGIYESRHEPENMRPLAEWYWRMLLTCSLFALFGVLTYGVWQFYGVVHTLSVAQNLKPSKQPELLSRTELEATLDLYEKRTEAFNAAKKARANVADPSR